MFSTFRKILVNFNAIEMCSSFSDLGDLEKIRNSHNKMREVFPISPDLWLRLIDTELSQDDINAEEMQQVDAIFKLALDDFYSKCVEIRELLRAFFNILF